MQQKTHLNIVHIRRSTNTHSHYKSSQEPIRITYLLGETQKHTLFVSPHIFSY